MKKAANTSADLVFCMTQNIVFYKGKTLGLSQQCFLLWQENANQSYNKRSQLSNKVTLDHVDNQSTKVYVLLHGKGRDH